MARPPALHHEVVIFTDGANEPSKVSVGGVLFTRTGPPQYFGDLVPARIVTAWRAAGGFQVIGQAELLPVYLASVLWSAELKDQYSIWFIDQNAARQAMAKGYSPAGRSATIIDSTTEMLARARTWPWFARVASASNIADGPSRQEFGEIVSLFPRAERRHIVWDEVLVGKV